MAAHPVTIDDPADPRIAGFVSIRERDLTGRDGMFVAEGATDRLRTLMREDFLTNVWPPVAEQMRRIGLDARTLLDLTDA